MSKIEKFVPLKTTKPMEKHSSIESEFTLNEFTERRKQKDRPENQLQPDLNEIQRFVKREY